MGRAFAYWGAAAVCLFVQTARAAEVPTRYDVSASLATVPLSGGRSFGSKFFFQTGNQAIYRIVPQGQTEANPATQWEYWSLTAGSRVILPVAGTDSLDIRGLNSRGEAVGQTTTASPAANAALYWTLSGGSTTPSGFDLGFSGLDVLNNAGMTAGFSYSAVASGPVRVRWNAAQPVLSPIQINPPAGYGSPQVVGVANSGEVLLYVTGTDAGGAQRLALWNGVTATLVGPAPEAGQTFYPANAAISPSGDIAMLVFTTGTGSTLHYIPAANRANWLTFSFPGAVESAYNLRISNAGVATFEAGIAGVSVVQVVSATRAEQRSFEGYRAFLNNAGALLFGQAGDLHYWQAAAWTGAPVTVPVSLTTVPGGLDVVGFNDDARLLVLNRSASSRELLILAPVFAGDTKVTLKPIRRTWRLTRKQDIRTRLVETRITGGGLQGRIRYQISGKLPPGLKFRRSEAIIYGAGKRAANTKIRVSALYKTDGRTMRSKPVTIRVRVR